MDYIFGKISSAMSTPTKPSSSTADEDLPVLNISHENESTAHHESVGASRNDSSGTSTRARSKKGLEDSEMSESSVKSTTSTKHRPGTPHPRTTSTGLFSPFETEDALDEATYEITILKAQVKNWRERAQAAEADSERLTATLDRAAKAKRAMTSDGKREQKLLEKIKDRDQKLAALQGQVETLEATAEHASQTATAAATARFRAHERDYMAQLQDLQTHINAETRLKLEAQMALSELRGYISVADSDDVARIIQALKDVNEACDDCAFELYRVSSSLPDTTRFSIADFKDAKFSFLHPLLEHVGAMNRGLNGSDFLLPVFKGILNHVVDRVLRTFHPSQAENATALSVVWRLLMKTESPRAVARWRAMTYRAIEPATPFTTFGETLVANELTAFFASKGVTLAADAPECLAAVANVFREVVKFQRLVRQEYLATELFTYAPAPSTGKEVQFSAKTMRDESVTKEGTHGGNVIALMAFGLSSLKAQDAETGPAKHTLLVPAVVLTKQFLQPL